MKKILVQTKPADKSVKLGKEALYIGFKYDMETVDKVKKLPKRFYAPKTKEWEVPKRYLAQVLEVFHDYHIIMEGEVNTKVQQKIDKVARFEKVDTANYQFKTKPYDYQMESFKYAEEHTRFLLGDEQGLGKTKQAIDIAAARKHQFKHCLIVCGVNSLKFNWMKEVSIHSNENAHILGTRLKKRGDGLKEGSVKERLQDLTEGRDEFFLITNIETLRNKDIQAQLEKMTEDGTIGMTIIDEIHKAKNAQSSQGKAIHKLKSYYKMALTGTVLMNQPTDLYNVLKWLGEEQKAFYSFRNHYCVMGGYGGYEVVGYKNLDELQRRLEKVQLRRKKEDVLDLPPKVRVTDYVEMTGKQAKLYKDIKQEIISQIDDIKLDPNPLSQLIRLRQVTGHPASLDKDVTESAKMERMYDLVEENVSAGRKTIIFSNWTKMTGPAMEKLKEFNPAIITGNTKDRQAEVEKFQNDESCKVIVGTIGAMGTGLTLTAASNVIFLDKPWNMANTEQAEDRAHRIGTKGTVVITTLVAKNSIDERIEDLVHKKGKMADALVDGKYDLSKEEMLDFLLA